MSQDLCERKPHAILEGSSHHVASPSSKLRAESAHRKQYKICIIVRV